MSRKPGSFQGNFKAQNKSRQFPGGFLLMLDVYVAVEQHSVRVFRAFAYLTIEEAFAFEVNLDECRTCGEGSLDQRL